LDYQYSKLKMSYVPDSSAITMGNADEYVEAGRFVSVSCLQGFTCPNGHTMKMCAEGDWCPENSQQPITCDGLSYCGEYSTYQINFVIPIVSAVITLIMFLISWRLTSSQKALELRTRGEARTLGPAATSGYSADAAEGIDISFENVSLTTPDGSGLLLNDISGRIERGSVYAVMGPTGCGKSSFVNVLRDGGSGGRVSGSIDIVNSKTGQVLSAAELSKYVGFVPQQDTLDRSLTVRELLMMHAMLRSGVTREEALARAAQVMSDLHIRHIGDTVIGGSETTPANISGGQLKRVNIACELVSIGRPAVLFLDEPTAGLDANIAKELVLLLKSLSKTGVLVVLSVQQPRPEIFQLFSRVLLMVSGGGIAFEGPPASAVPYLASMGYKPSEDVFDADFCIDVLNDIVQPSVELDECFCAADLGDKWRARSHHHSHQSSLVPVEMIGSESPEEAELGTSSPRPVRSRPKDKVIPEVLLTESVGKVIRIKDCWDNFDAQRFWKQVTLSVERQFLTSLRNRMNLYVYMGLQVSGAVFLSVAFSPLIDDLGYGGTFQAAASKSFMPYLPAAVLSKTRNNSDIGFKQMMFFLPAILGAMTALCAVPLFSGRVSVLKRESQTGVSSLASGLGFMLFDLFIVLWMAINYNAAWQLFGHAGHYYHWFLVIIFTSFAASGIGYITGVSVAPMSANTVAVVSSIIFAVFSGVEPSLRQVSKLNVVSIPWYLSYATWTAEGTYYTWTQYLSSAGIYNEYRVEMGADHYGYDVTSLSRAIGCLIALGVGFRILALIMLHQRCNN
jgi:ABC-type multidrug transport system ATPase subunit